MRTWISKRGAEEMRLENMCAAWIELGGGRMLWIMEDGDHGIASDNDEWNGDEPLSFRLSQDKDDWEQL